MKNNLSTSENLYRFAGWLTSRTEKAVFSAKDDATPVAILVDAFIATQGLEFPRENWNKLEHVPMPKIETRKALEFITKEDAEGALFKATGGQPSGYKYINHDGQMIVFNYTNNKGRLQAQRFKFEQLGFKAFNFLQSRGYILG